MSRAGAPVHVRPKVFQVLAYLLEHRDRVVSKPELMEQVWPGQSVSDETLDSCIALARRAVGDSARVQAVIQTRHGFGHRFVAAVEVRDSPVAGRRPPDSPPVARLPWGRRPTDAALASVPAPTASLVSRHTPHQRLLAGEQKLVTVLVCTLAQAAAWAQRLEAEVWHQALQAFLPPVSRQCSAMGGPSSTCGTMGSWCCLGRRWRRRTTPGGRCGRRWGCSSASGGCTWTRHGLWTRRVSSARGCIRGGCSSAVLATMGA